MKHAKPPAGGLLTGDRVTNQPPRADDRETLALYDRDATAYAARDGKGGAGALARFMARLPPGVRVLDLGSGDGRHSQTMERAGFDVTAIDGSAGLAAIASKRLTKPVRVQTFDALDDEANRWRGSGGGTASFSRSAPAAG